MKLIHKFNAKLLQYKKELSNVKFNLQVEGLKGSRLNVERFTRKRELETIIEVLENHRYLFKDVLK
jgi:hypothetical protein